MSVYYEDARPAAHAEKGYQERLYQSCLWPRSASTTFEATKKQRFRWLLWHADPQTLWRTCSLVQMDPGEKLTFQQRLRY